MKKIVFDKVDENIYYEKINNQVDLYLYPVNKTKNFYITITVKFGAKVMKYKLGDNIYDVIPGSAHFLEHKVMSFSEDPRIVNMINSLGLQANAYTSWDVTNYNLYGSENIEESIKLLLDMFYKPNITLKNVEEEKGIICEEIDMTNDRLETMVSFRLFDNLFNSSYLNNTILGTKDDINSLTYKKLMKVYDDFYVPENTFITVCGSFDKDKVYNVINDYIKGLKLKNKKAPKVIKKREKDNIKVNLEKVYKRVSCPKVRIGYKINKKIFNIKDNNKLYAYIHIILSSNISCGSALYDKYINEKLVLGLGISKGIFDNHLVISVNATTYDAKKFVDRINKDINHLTLSKEDFERKKKLYLKSYILEFDDIINVESLITDHIIDKNKINPNVYNDIMSLKYEEALDVMKRLKFDNYSVIVVNDEK